MEDSAAQPELARRAWARLAPFAAGRLFEPFLAYACVTDQPGHAILASEGVVGLPRVTQAGGVSNFVFCGHRASLGKVQIEFDGSDNILFLGAHATPGHCKIRVHGSGHVFHFGSFSSASSLTVLLQGEGGKILVGDDCMFSARIILSNSDQHAIYQRATGARINRERDVLIEDHVWLGRDVRVSKGSRIGRDSIIAQGAVVSGEIAAHVVAGGLPARMLQTDVTWSRVRADSLAEAEASPGHRQRLLRAEKLRRRIAALEAGAGPA
ncbi:acyltransferase [Falsiroseomonas sp.]|uniref:acyltransferase n=1 Tax=Falsiroseomonas sp. TaxID=2870721 RepID=UPI003F70C023